MKPNNIGEVVSSPDFGGSGHVSKPYRVIRKGNDLYRVHVVTPVRVDNTFMVMGRNGETRPYDGPPFILRGVTRTVETKMYPFEPVK